MPVDTDFPRGSVWLVGAGPGDPDLLTRKAARLMGEADAVFYDALVTHAVLGLARRGARRIAVGKRSGRHSQDQASINALLIAAARRGERVVRLKGGDPAMFGRASEEIEALCAAGIAIRICPGITAASAAAASARLSLSLRGVARKVQFVTAHRRAGGSPAIDWGALADPQASTAFYMGRGAASAIGRGLVGAGLDPATPVMVACDVSLPSERLVHTRLDLLPLAVEAIAEDSPTLILVGQAMTAGGAAPPARGSLVRHPTF